MASRLQLVLQGEEQISDLAECLQRVLNVAAKPAPLSREPQQASRELVVSEYHQALKQLANLAFRREGALDVGALLSPETLKLPAKARNNPYFVFVRSHLSLHFTIAEGDAVLDETGPLEAYLQQQSGQLDEPKGALSEDEYWQRMAALMRRPSKYHGLIAMHLRDRGLDDLSDYFDSQLKGDPLPISVDISLLERNPYYRQFVFTLQRQCTWEARNDPDIASSKELAAVAVKELLFKILLKENFDCQREHLRAYSDGLLATLRDCLLDPSLSPKTLPLL
jgi:hypothetical protein